MKTISRSSITSAISATMLALALTACSASNPVVAEQTENSGNQTAAQGQNGETEIQDPATEAVCQSYFGDPNYSNPQNHEVLSKIASLDSLASSNPEFITQTDSDLAATFGESQGEVRDAARALGSWFATEAVNPEVDLSQAQTLINNLATACAPVSVGAAWNAGINTEAGTKPAALVCSEIVSEPQVFKPFQNGDVLFSNLLATAGFDPIWMDQNRQELYVAVDAQLEQLKTEVDDDALRESIETMQLPFKNAIEGNYSSPGVYEALTSLGEACSATGFEGAGDLINSDPSSTEGEEDSEEITELR